jgi:hypothetical protein
MNKSSEGPQPSLKDRVKGFFSKKTPEPPKPKTPEEILAESNKKLLTRITNQTILNYEIQKEIYGNNDIWGEPNYYKFDTVEKWKKFIKERGWKTHEDIRTLVATDMKKASEMSQDMIELNQWCEYQTAKRINNGEIDDISTFDEYNQAIKNLNEQIIPKSTPQTPTE